MSGEAGLAAKAAYGALALLAVLTLATRGGQRSQRRYGVVALHLYLAISALSLATLVGSPYMRDPVDVLSDVATFGVPGLVALLAVRRPGLCLGVLSRSFILVLAVASLGGPAFSADNGRFEPPALPLFLVLFAVSLVDGKQRLRVAARVALVLVVLLVISSGQRAAQVTLGLGGVTLFWATTDGRKAIVRLTVVTTASGLIVLLLAGSDQVGSLIARSRFTHANTSESDEGRLHEARLVMQEWSEGDVYTYLLGSGPGAAYLSDGKFIEANIRATDGRVHAVHVGPARVLFRNGVLGLALTVSAWALIAKQYFYLRRCFLKRRERQDLAKIVVTVASLSYILESLVSNPSLDLVAVVCLGTAAGTAIESKGLSQPRTLIMDGINRQKHVSIFD